jgi:hypothetical protein
MLMWVAGASGALMVFALVVGALRERRQQRLTPTTG